MNIKVLLSVSALAVMLFASGCRDEFDPVDPGDNGDTLNKNIPTAGLVAHYPLNGNANDRSGNNYNGVVSGATLTTDRFGRANHAYLFDGINDFIGVYNLTGSKLEPKEGITISCFVKATSDAGNEPWSRIIRKAGDFQNGYVLSWNHENNIMLQSFLLYNCIPEQFKTPNDKISLSNSPLIGAWHHIAMSYSVQSNVLKIYIDGKLASSLANCNYNFQHSSDKLGIGGSAGNVTSDGKMRYESFPGSIDAVRIYDRALTDSEINILYNEKD